jgi:hypothetical protein
MKRFALLLAASVALAAPAWADSYGAPPPGPAPMAMPGLPGPAPGLARLYIYRDDGSTLHPSWTAVSLDGAKVGDAAPGTFFYRDVPAGAHTLSVNSDLPYADQTKTLSLAPNSTIFVRVYSVEGYGITIGGGVSGGRHGGGSIAVGVPNVFGERIVDPRVAQPAIARLQPAA